MDNNTNEKITQDNVEMTIGNNENTAKDENIVLEENNIEDGEKENDTTDSISSSQCVYDLIYSPPLTKLLNTAKNKGAKYVNGMNMLAYQGAESFAIWENVNPPYEIMSMELSGG